MKFQLRAALLIFFLIIPFGSASALPLVDAEIALGGWMYSPEGFAGYKGTDLDLEDDLGYEDETGITGRFRMELPLLLPNVTFMTTDLTYEGDSKRGAGFEFGGKTFAADTEFSSKLSLDHHDIAVSFSLPLLNLASLGKLQADLGVNLRLMDIEAEITQNGLNESKDMTVPIPMGYAYLRLEPVSGIALEAEARALAVGDNNMTSIIGRARYNIFGPVFVAGGYRVEKIDIDEEDVKIDTDFKGPFFEAGFKF